MNDRSHYGAMLAAGIAALIMVVHSLVSRQGSFHWFELAFWTVMGCAWVVTGICGVRNGASRPA